MGLFTKPPPPPPPRTHSNPIASPPPSPRFAVSLLWAALLSVAGLICVLAHATYSETKCLRLSRWGFHQLNSTLISSAPPLELSNIFQFVTCSATRLKAQSEPCHSLGFLVFLGDLGHLQSCLGNKLTDGHHRLLHFCSLSSWGPN